jgi:hypothetical protein
MLQEASVKLLYVMRSCYERRDMPCVVAMHDETNLAMLSTLLASLDLAAKNCKEFAITILQVHVQTHAKRRRACSILLSDAMGMSLRMNWILRCAMCRACLACRVAWRGRSRSRLATACKPKQESTLGEELESPAFDEYRNA